LAAAQSGDATIRRTVRGIRKASTGPRALSRTNLTRPFRDRDSERTYENGSALGLSGDPTNSHGPGPGAPENVSMDFGFCKRRSRVHVLRYAFEYIATSRQQGTNIEHSNCNTERQSTTNRVRIPITIVSWTRRSTSERDRKKRAGPVAFSGRGIRKVNGLPGRGRFPVRT